MRQTLFTIDHFLFENHWILIGWLILGLIYIGYQFFWGTKSEAFQFLLIYAVGIAIVYFVFPKLETLGIDATDPNGPLVPSGLAIRGYGLFLLLAMVTGFGLSLYRCRQLGFDGDKILSLCFWMVVAGIVGARLFYVIQKFDSFSGMATGDLVFRLLDMTSGGLVVYGSLIGGVAAAIVYLKLNDMPWRAVADILAPGMVIGLAVGRIGCLMNGCCYGGVCDESFPGIYFPAGSPPYVQQLSSGQLLGIRGDFDAENYTVQVESVAQDSLAEQTGIKPGDVVRIFLTHEQQDDSLLRIAAAKQGAEIDIQAVVDGTAGGPIFIPADKLPDRSRKTQPTQIYSSINALLLSAFLWFYFPYRGREGEVFALLLILYPIGRFLLEIVRRDEAGQFGTSFTISQWFSVAIFIVGIGLLIFVRTRPAETPTSPVVKPNVA